MLTAARSGSGQAEHDHAAAAATALAAYSTAHRAIRSADDAGDLIGAIQLASTSAAAGLPAASTALDGALTAGIAASQRSFAADMGDAADALVPMMVLTVPLLGVACLLILLGMQRRIDEYR